MRSGCERTGRGEHERRGVNGGGGFDVVFIVSYTRVKKIFDFFLKIETGRTGLVVYFL